MYVLGIHHALSVSFRVPLGAMEAIKDVGTDTASEDVQ